MSCPQQSGDLTLPQPLGHFDTSTRVPSGVVMESSTSSAPHLAHVMLTLMPHLLQVYADISITSAEELIPGIRPKRPA